MRWARWVTVALVTLAALHMLASATRSLIAGQATTLFGGAPAWAQIVQVLGVDPSSWGLHLFLVGYAVVWLAMLGLHLAGPEWAWQGLVIMALGSLWYLVLGTLLAMLQIPALAVEKAHATRYG